MYRSLNIVDKDKTAKKIKQYRIKCKMTMQQLSELTGIHKQTIYRIENAKQEVRLCTLQKIANALGVAINKLM